MKIRESLRRGRDAGAVAIAALLLTPGIATAEYDFSAVAEIEEETTVAQAEEGQEPETRRRSTVGIEEITVTARKREESLQDTPLSVSAFSAQDLIDKGVSRADDIGKFTPNLTFDQAANGQNDSRLTIRGIGNGDPIAARDPGVGLYVDGVYLARAQGGLLGLVDIERVEVLRGPQGTLFGRNTIGGAVNIVTKKPQDEFETNARVRIGNFNLFESRLSVNVPLVPETAAMRVSFQTTDREGYSKNRLTGQETDDRRLLAGRVAFRLNPSENVELNISGEQTRSHTAGRGAECRAQFPDVEKPDATLLPRAPLIVNLGGDQFVPQLGGLVPTGFTPVQNCVANERDGNELKFNSPVRGKDNLDTYGLSAVLDWDLDTMQFKATTSWRRQEIESRQDFSFQAESVNVSATAPLNLEAVFGIDPNDEAVGILEFKGVQFDQVSQEFNLSGEGMDGRLQWTGGLYGFYEKTNPGRTSLRVAFDSLCQLASIGAGQARAAAMAPGADPNALVTALNNEARACGASNLQAGPRLRTVALAGYGQATFDVSDRFHVTAGARYSVESKTFKFSQMNFSQFDPTRSNPAAMTNPLAVGPRTDVLGNPVLDPDGNQIIDDCPICGGKETSERFSKWTPVFTLAYDVNDDSMVYATYSRGFKSGGFNGRPNANVPLSLLPFDQEELTNYEIGFKSMWFDNRLIANVSAFYGIYDDIQQTLLLASSMGDFASRVANAGEAVIRGAEVEVRGALAPGLLFSVGLGFLDAEYREFDDPQEDFANPGTFNVINRRNEEFFQTPSFSATIGASYTLYDLGVLGDMTTALNWYHQDEVNYGPMSDTLEQGKYGLLSGQITFALPDGLTEIAIFGENLLDRRYVNSGVNFEDGFAASFAFFGAPRMYGVEIRRSF